jgi:Holliday junction resolvase RusA-like endonuclease
VIVFTVPGAPQGKGRARSGRTKSGQVVHYTPAKTRSYEALVALAAHQAMAGRVPWPRESFLECWIRAFLAPPASWSARKRNQALSAYVCPTGKPDLDNIIKAVLDACNGILWVDDSSILRLTAMKEYAEIPELCVSVRDLREK